MSNGFGPWRDILRTWLSKDMIMSMPTGTRPRAFIQILMCSWIPATARMKTEIWFLIITTFPSEAPGRHLVIRNVAM